MAAAFVRGALESPTALASRLRMAPSASSLLRANARRPGGQERRRGRELVVALCKAADPVAKEAKAATGFTSVMKFGGSSVASTERMSEAAALILSFPEEMPVVVLSAMGRTNNNLLLAGEKAVKCKSPCEVSGIHELLDIKQLHLRTVDDLGLDRSIVSDLLDRLEQLLNAIATVKELTPRTRDKLVSFGTCMSTRIFAAYLNELGKKSRQYDAFDIGFTTTDDFTNAAILEATYPAVAKRLQGDLIDDPAIPIVTDSLGMGQLSQAITTLGSGGSDLTAMTISKALGLRENQVWKYVDGLLTRDPNIYANMKLITNLTSDATTELADFREQIYSRMKKTEDNKEFMAYMSSWYMANILSLVTSRMRRQAVMLTGGTLFLTGFITLAIYPAAPIIGTILLIFGVGLTAQALCSQSMQPAGEGDIPSPFITKARDRSKSILTSIVLKPNVVVLEIVSTKIDDQYGFLPKVLSICEDFNISMDYVAANEVSVLLALNPSKLWSREFIQKKLDDVIAELEDIGVVRLMAFRSIISLTGNVQRSSLIHEKAFNVLHRNGVKFMIHMTSQGPSKVNISLVVHHNEAKQCVEALRSEFFENGFSPKAKAEEDVPLNGSALNPNDAI